MITIILSDKSEYNVENEVGEKLKEAFIAGNLPEYVSINGDVIRTSWIGKIIGGKKISNNLLPVGKPKIMVRWTDKDGKERSKVYDDEPTAQKAKKWLIDNGTDTVDIAIVNL